MPYNNLARERRIKATIPMIEKSIYKKACDLKVKAWLTQEPVPFSKRMSGREVSLNNGDNWGNLFDCAWFQLTGSIPDENSSYVIIIDISGEGCVVDKNGSPVQGITTVASMYDFRLGKPGKRIMYPKSHVFADGSFEIWIDAGNNDLFGNQTSNGTLVEAYVAEQNEAMRMLHYDFEVLNELRDRLDSKKAQYHTITNALHNASLKLSEYTFDEALEASAILKPELKRINGDHPLRISAIGHAHIDLAWLWPIRETIRKGARTFSTVLMNMGKYPDYIFGASQPQLYQWMKEYYPVLYQRIKETVAAGRWEPQGAMWVEADTNITGGESLIRQILYGKKFYRDEFNYDVRNVWLPDVFGYSAALPQIMKKSGVDYFMTIKISWSEFNDFPHHTFIWKGIDGSTVIAHMPPEGTYNSSAAPRAVLDCEEKFADKGVSGDCLLLFGIGDGGGGPGEEHLERLAREKNLLGLAPVSQEFTAEFFNRLEGEKEKFKTWSGELYLEHHRGTYTSEGRSKRYNKLMENLLRDAEIAGIMAGTGYDKNRVETIWKEVLLYQFHDILPGSSIKRVYDESLARYEILENDVNDLAGFINDCNKNDAKIMNTLSWRRKGWLKIRGSWKYYDIPPMSIVNTSQIGNKTVEVSINEYENMIFNKHLAVKFNEIGELISIFDKNCNREVIKDMEAANKLAVYVDEGDAWDFPHDYKEHGKLKLELIGSSYEQDGPEAKRINRYSFGESKITQEIVLAADSARLDIRNKIEWREGNKMLRSEFPLTVSSSHLTCGIQFGYIQRPSINNTMWDMAKIEVCGQNYVDITQGNYGVAVMSDYKYGYSSTEDTIDICLLRSTSYPDVSGDIGCHEFTYSVFPHKGNHLQGKVIEKAFELSRPLRMINSECTFENTGRSFVTVDRENIFIETIKASEDGEGTILRLYEAYGYESDAVMSFSKNYTAIEEVNLVEDQINGMIDNGNKIIVKFSPFEIKTFKLME
jgi:alpha-mannosidase